MNMYVRDHCEFPVRSREVTGGHGRSREVTGGHGRSREVTGGHGRSREVTVNSPNNAHCRLAITQ